jgi:hypothetical protein
MSDSPFIFGDGSTLDDLASSVDALVLLLTREEIEAGRVGSAVDRLMTLSDRREHVLRFAQGVFIMVTGYDHDPRELPQIPEVVRFVRQIDAAWPYAMHFFEIEGDSLALWLHMLIETRPLSHGPGRVYSSIDREALSQSVRQHLDAVDNLHIHHQLDENEHATITRRISEMLARHIL